jgi:ABC-type Fe3+ transport system permease subunit
MENARFSPRIGHAGAAFTMTPRALKILSASSWGVLLICGVVFLYLAIAIPNVISESIINDRGKNVQEIRSSTDLHEVQQIATLRTQEEAYISDSARMLLIIAVITLLLCILCSSISLFQIRRLRKQLGQQQK